VHHLERALAEQVELDPAAEAVVRLRAETLRRCDETGLRALARGDAPAAERLLGRAAELTDDPASLARLLAARGQALAEGGQLAAAMVVFDDALEAASQAGDARLLATTRIAALWVAENLDLGGWIEQARAASEDAIEVFERAADVAGLARAWGLRVEIHYLLGQYEQAGRAARRAESFASEAGQETEVRDNALAQVITMLPGPPPLDEVAEACQQLEDRYPDHDALRARLRQIRAIASAMTGRAGHARSLIAQALASFEDLGQWYWHATAMVTRGQVETFLGDVQAAGTAMRHGMDALDGLGDRAQAATAAGQLACLLPPAQVEEIDRLAAYAGQHAHPDDLEAQVRTELARAHLAASRSQERAALASLDRAVAVSQESDALVLRADAHLARARCHHRLGAAERTVADAGAAQELYLAKGHRFGVTWAQRLLEGYDRIDDRLPVRGGNGGDASSPPVPG
jgi:tetratricopeptide (TPR) repeat protein